MRQILHVSQSVFWHKSRCQIGAQTTQTDEFQIFAQLRKKTAGSLLISSETTEIFLPMSLSIEVEARK